MNQPTDKVSEPFGDDLDTTIKALREIAAKPEDKFSHRYFAGHAAALLEQRAATSADRSQEGYPGIAHDFETMRSALVQIRDECFNGHAHDIAEAALNAAPQAKSDLATAYVPKSDSAAGVSEKPAVAAPNSSARSTEEATIHADALMAIESFCEDTHLTHLNDRLAALVEHIMTRAFALSAKRATEPMADAVRGVLQLIRGKAGATFHDVRNHCQLRGDDMTPWPDWILDAEGYVTEQAAAMMIYEIMARAEGAAK